MTYYYYYYKSVYLPSFIHRPCVVWFGACWAINIVHCVWHCLCHLGVARACMIIITVSCIFPCPVPYATKEAIGDEKEPLKLTRTGTVQYLYRIIVLSNVSSIERFK